MTKNKRVVFTQGGKGGVGKTTFANDLADWYRRKELPVKLLDFDTENKASSGFSYFNEDAERFNINRDGSLDAILKILDDPDHEIMLIDQAAASGEQTFEWFQEMGAEAREMGIQFTSVGLITNDPGSVESVLTWTTALGENAEYLIVKNKMENKREEFSAWNKNKTAKKLANQFDYREIVMGSRLPEFEELIRTAGLTPGQALSQKSGQLAETRWKMRSKAYARQSDELLDSVSDLLLANDPHETSE